MTDVTIKPPSADLFYVTIDGTKAIDSVAIGERWKLFGWKNLLSGLNIDKSDPSRRRRIDTAHPHLPIKLVSEQQQLPKGAGNTFSDIVIMPEGIDGTGVDVGNWPSRGASGNSPQINEANKFIRGFILSPSCDPAASSLGSGTRVADLVYVSSHGIRTGDMFGSASDLIDEVDPFFILAVAADSAQQSHTAFVGVKWLILSNCNTLVPGTHNDWLTLIGFSSGFRGILGYQNTSVPADESSAADVLFVKYLNQGESLRDAWRHANVDSNMTDRWIVICRDPAKDDTISQWNSGTLPPVAAASAVTLFDEGHQAGVPVVNHPNPFGVFWSKIVGGVATRITPLNRYDLGNKIRSSTAASVSLISITVTSAPTVPSFPAGAVIELTLIFVRDDYPEPINIDRMFTVVGTGGPGITATSAHRNNRRPSTGPSGVDPGNDTWVLTIPATIASVTLTLRIDRLFLGDVHHNLQFWLRASFTAPGGIKAGPFDFERDGVIFTA
jgi:Family of unknown function (DUF6345)